MTKPTLPEKRSLEAQAPSITGKTIYGYASRFGVRSENLGTPDRPVYEIIEKTSFDGRLMDDVVCLFNHDSNQVLARSNKGKGSLKLSIDSIGLRYEFEAPDTQLGRDLVALMKRGDVCSSSFSFSVAPDGETWTTNGKEKIRHVKKISRLYDTSVVVNPAYAAADANLRSRAGKVSIKNLTPLQWRVRLLDRI
jgi:uncharacterized protein